MKKDHNTSLRSRRRFLAKALPFSILGASFFGLPSTVIAGENEQWQTQSKNGLFEVSLKPQEGSVVINKLQNWEVTIHDQKGRAVNPAQVYISGGMEAHGHGLPTQPQVTDYLGEGRYLIEGMRLTMAGKWTILIGVETAAHRDLSTFEIEIDF